MTNTLHKPANLAQFIVALAASERDKTVVDLNTEAMIPVLYETITSSLAYQAIGLEVEQAWGAAGANQPHPRQLAFEAVLKLSAVLKKDLCDKVGADISDDEMGLAISEAAFLGHSMATLS